MRNRLSEIKVSQEKLVEVMLKDGIDTEMLSLLNQKAKNLSEEKKTLLEKIETLESEESEIINVINLSKKWKTANFEERRAVCNLLIEKIFIDNNGAVEVIWNI